MRELGAQTPSLKQARLGSSSETRLPSRGRRGLAGSGVVRGALSGLKVGAPHLGRGARTQAPAGLGTCLGSEASKRLRLPARVPRNDQTLAVGAGRGVRQPRARCRHGADALPAERPPGEPLAPGPHVPRALRPAAVRGRLLPRPPYNPGLPGSAASRLGGLGALGAQAPGQSCPPQPLLDTRAAEEGCFFSPPAHPPPPVSACPGAPLPSSFPAREHLACLV